MAPKQLYLFQNDSGDAGNSERSGTFVDNMKLAIHRWFRYSAGFSAEWVEDLILENYAGRSSLILDPFAGSGTALLAADAVGVPSLGIEAHPFVARVAKAKMLWHTSIDRFTDAAYAVLHKAKNMEDVDLTYPELIHRCFDLESLRKLNKIKRAWAGTDDDRSPEYQLVWLAITSILRPTSKVGTAQWQYILPRITKKIVADPYHAFCLQIEIMKSDMLSFQKRTSSNTHARLIQGDARDCPDIVDSSVDVVITSPPYTNNYDYADATRLEMSFWGEVQSWADLHKTVRKYLITSCSQHARKNNLTLKDVLNAEILKPIQPELSIVCDRLAEERLLHGGRKHYHTMVAAYFRDMALVWQELRRLCKKNSKLCFVIGDSAPYGVYVPVDRWLGELAMAASFREYYFEKLRDRNVKWKNRKHRVPLHEGRLWVEG